MRVGVADGYLGDFSHPDRGDGVYLTWRIEALLWAQLSARGITPERLVEIAADVRFVDRATWDARYETSIDDYRMAPTTTTGVPESSS